MKISKLHCYLFCSVIKATLTYPATEKHILKYSDQKKFIIEETSSLYEELTLPFVLSEYMNIEVG